MQTHHDPVNATDIDVALYLTRKTILRFSPSFAAYARNSGRIQGTSHVFFPFFHGKSGQFLWIIPDSFSPVPEYILLLYTPSFPYYPKVFVLLFGYLPHKKIHP